MVTLAISNQKGGIGKTTTARELSNILFQSGYKVLGVDLDPQRNLSKSYTSAEPQKTVYEVLTQGEKIENCVVSEEVNENFSLLPASKMLSGIDGILNGVGAEYKLKESLEQLKDSFDFCVIDCPPALNILSVNAFVCADYIIIPAQADFYSLDGIQETYNTIETVKKYCNHSLKVAGILLTRHNQRAILSRDIEKMLRDNMSETLNYNTFNTIIRECIAVKECVFRKQTLYDYDRTATAYTDYENLVKELLEIIQRDKEK